MRETTTWRTLIYGVAEGDKITHCTLTEEELDKPFDSGYGTSEGKSFTAWSDTYVYFPVVYDGAEWADRAPRHPCDVPTEHVGG